MTSSRSRLTRAVALSACFAVAGLIGAQPSTAASTKTYSCGSLPVKSTPAGLYGGYLTKISAKGRYSKKSSACRSAKSLVLAYYRCRARKRSLTASCNNRTINGLKCKERNRKYARNTSGKRVWLDADVTCTKGSKRIKHHYQQGLIRQ